MLKDLQEVTVTMTHKKSVKEDRNYFKKPNGNSQVENTITEMKNSLEGLNSKCELAE